MNFPVSKWLKEERKADSAAWRLHPGTLEAGLNCRAKAQGASLPLTLGSHTEQDRKFPTFKAFEGPALLSTRQCIVFILLVGKWEIALSHWVGGFDEKNLHILHAYIKWENRVYYFAYITRQMLTGLSYSLGLYFLIIVRTFETSPRPRKVLTAHCSIVNWLYGFTIKFASYFAGFVHSHHTCVPRLNEFLLTTSLVKH